MRIDLQKQTVYDSGFNLQLENILGQGGTPNATRKQKLAVGESGAVFIGHDPLGEGTNQSNVEEFKVKELGLRNLKDPNRQIFQTENYMEPESSFNHLMDQKDINWGQDVEQSGTDFGNHNDFNQQMNRVLGMADNVVVEENESNLDDMLEELEGRTERNLKFDNVAKFGGVQNDQLFDDHEMLKNNFLTEEEQNQMIYSGAKLNLHNINKDVGDSETDDREELKNYEYNDLQRVMERSANKKGYIYDTEKEETSHVSQTEGGVEVGDSLQGLPGHDNLLMDLERYHTEHVREVADEGFQRSAYQMKTNNKNRHLERYRTETYDVRDKRPPVMGRGRKYKKKGGHVAMSQTLKESADTNDFIDGNEMSRNIKLGVSSSMDARSSGISMKRPKREESEERKDKKKRRREKNKKPKRSNKKPSLRAKISESHFGKKSTAQEIDELTNEFSKHDLSHVSGIVKRDLSKRMNKRTKTLGNLKPINNKKVREGKRLSGRAKNTSQKGNDLKRINTLGANRGPKALYHKSIVFRVR